MIGDTRDYVKLVPMVKNQKMLDVSFILGFLVLILMICRCHQVNLFWERVRREKMVERILMMILRFALVIMLLREMCVMLLRMAAVRVSEM